MTHPELQTALETAAAAVFVRIENLEECVAQHVAANAALTEQVNTLTQERDQRPTCEQWQAIQADLAAAQAAPAELRAQVDQLNAEVARLTSELQNATTPPQTPA